MSICHSIRAGTLVDLPCPDCNHRGVLHVRTPDGYVCAFCEAVEMQRPARHISEDGTTNYH